MTTTREAAPPHEKLPVNVVVGKPVTYSGRQQIRVESPELTSAYLARKADQPIDIYIEGSKGAKAADPVWSVYGRRMNADGTQNTARLAGPMTRKEAISDARHRVRRQVVNHNSAIDYAELKARADYLARSAEQPPSDATLRERAPTLMRERLVEAPRNEPAVLPQKDSRSITGTDSVIAEQKALAEVAKQKVDPFDKHRIDAITREIERGGGSTRFNSGHSEYVDSGLLELDDGYVRWSKNAEASRADLAARRMAARAEEDALDAAREAARTKNSA